MVVENDGKATEKQRGFIRFLSGRDTLTKRQASAVIDILKNDGQEKLESATLEPEETSEL